MTQNFTPGGGMLSPEEVAKAQNEINQSLMGSTGSSGSGGSGGSGTGGSDSGRTVKPGDKIKAKDAISGNQSGGMVSKGDKIEAQSEMNKGNPIG
ncbi:hypothetical protein MASR2M70_02800 [Bacillota bacterium]